MGGQKRWFLGGGGRANFPDNFKELDTKIFIAAQSCKTWGQVTESRNLIFKNADPSFLRVQREGW